MLRSKLRSAETFRQTGPQGVTANVLIGPDDDLTWIPLFGNDGLELWKDFHARDCWSQITVKNFGKASPLNVLIGGPVKILLW